MLFWTKRQLSSTDAATRYAAVLKLSASRDPATLPLLVPLLRDPDEGVQGQAATAVGALGGEAALRALIEMLAANPPRNLHAKILGALAAASPAWSQSPFFAAALPNVLPLLGSAGPFATADLIAAVGRVRDPRAVGPLLRLLDEKGTPYLTDVAAALAEIGVPSVLPLVEASGDKNGRLRDGAQAALPRLGTAWAGAPAAREIIPRLLELLQRGFAGQRVSAAWALGAIGDARAAEALVQALGDEKDRVRTAAAEALGKIRDPRTMKDLTEALFARLADPRGKGFLDAAQGLARLKERRAIEPLVAALSVHAGTPLVKPIVEALDTIDPAWALGAIPDSVIDGLIAGLAAASDESLQALRALVGRIGRRTVPNLLRALEGPDARTRRETALALGSVKDTSALGPLLRALGDPDDGVRAATRGALDDLDPGWTSSAEAAAAAVAHLRAGKGISLLGAPVLKVLRLVAAPEAIAPLVQASSENDACDEAVAALTEILGRRASDASAESLRLAAEMKDPVAWHKDPDNWDGLEAIWIPGQTHERTVDASRVRELAQRELARRGG